MTLHRLTEEDIPAVAELEKLCFADPWSEESVRFLTSGAALGVCVGDENMKVAAYGGMLSAVDEGQILNIAVHPDARRKGYGKAVVTALLEEAEKSGFVRMTLEVRVSNLPALALYRGAGFCEVGRRRNFYSHPVEDALIMERVLRDE